MLDYLFKIKKFIPTIIVKTIYDVDFTTLYANGKRFILFDLDNTLISYDVDFADEKLKSLITELKNMGYTLMVVHPIKKGTEKWYTKNNRKMEKSVIKRIKKYDINIYKQIEENHEY